MSERTTTADVLRGWAADADEAMQAPLLELAKHAEEELVAAKTGTERAVLGIVAEAFQSPRPEPEAFAVRNAVTVLRDLVADESDQRDAALERAKDAEAHLWRIARAVNLAPDDHATLPVNAVVMRVERLAAFHAAVVKALPAVPA